MTESKSKKRLVRRLMAVRECVYTAALEELRGLPSDASWTAYVERVERRSSWWPAPLRAALILAEPVAREEIKKQGEQK